MDTLLRMVESYFLTFKDDNQFQTIWWRNKISLFYITIIMVFDENLNQRDSYMNVPIWRVRVTATLFI